MTTPPPLRNKDERAARWLTQEPEYYVTSVLAELPDGALDRLERQVEGELRRRGRSDDVYDLSRLNLSPAELQDLRGRRHAPPTP
jgi:hypothetical protein